MRVVKPTPFARSMLLSTTASDTTPQWVAGTYAKGAVVLRDAGDSASGAVMPYRWECQADGTTATPGTDDTLWVNIGPSNTWAAFDAKISTRTATATQLRMVIKTGRMSVLALQGLAGLELDVIQRDGTGGAILFRHQQSLNGRVNTSYYDWFFAPRVQIEDVLISGFSAQSSSVLEITITGPTAAVGQVIFGQLYALGDTAFGAQSGFRDYSTVEADSYGERRIVRRDYSRTLTCKGVLSHAEYARVSQIIASLRATPCLWIGGDEVAGYEPLMVYGIVTQAPITVDYATTHYVDFTIEGMI